MISGTIWNQLKWTLEQNPTLKGYVKYVFEGRRFDIDSSNFPCIMLDPVTNNEIIREMNNVKEVAMSVDVYAFSSVSHNDFAKTIVGDQSYKGILNIENDIRGVLMASNTLGNIVIDIVAGESVFDQIDLEKYPVRGILMPIRIKYMQRDGV